MHSNMSDFVIFHHRHECTNVPISEYQNEVIQFTVHFDIFKRTQCGECDMDASDTNNNDNDGNDKKRQRL